jgi:hypothetical protein
MLPGDDGLTEVTEAWPHLAGSVRAEILAMIRAARREPPASPEPDS